MKTLWALVAILFTFTLVVDEAEARRMGGGKSFGRSYQTAPAPSRSTADAPARKQDMAGKQAPGAGRGMMGGLLGGLLVGGLFAALFAGGAFEGLQMMDILIIAALAFVIFKVIRGMRQGPAPARGPQPAYAGAGQQTPSQPSSPQPVFGASREAPADAPVSSAAAHAVPFNLPLGFDTPAFLEGAKDHYRILQDAWNKNDLPKIQEYVTPELYADLQAERAALPAEQHTEVLSVSAGLVRADQQFGNAEVSIRFVGRYRDTVEGVEEDFVDIWHLERDYSKDDAPWFITGIQSE